MTDYERARRMTLDELAEALGKVDSKQVDEAVNAIMAARRVFAVGVGRVLLMLQAMVKRLNHIGVEAYFVGEINEAFATDEDLLIVGSGSGESVVPVAIAKVAHAKGVKILHIGSNMASSVSEIADYTLRIPCGTKLRLPDEIKSEQLMGSLFEQALLLLGDNISYLIYHKKGMSGDDLWGVHANLE